VGQGWRGPGQGNLETWAISGTWRGDGSWRLRYLRWRCSSTGRWGAPSPRPRHLYGGIGDDRVRGGPGDDRLSGGFGADSLDGEGGEDLARGDATIDAIGDSGGGSDTL
jgi:hypothetical protein